MILVYIVDNIERDMVLRNYAFAKAYSLKAVPTTDYYLEVKLKYRRQNICRVAHT
ncbi:MAG: hypothetical protein WBA16_01460 [Nonlabens sp.]